MKKQNLPSFAETICDMRIRKVKSIFFAQVNKLIDWKPISRVIDQHDKRVQSAVGQKAYDGLILFKMCLLQNWYGLSDYEVEERVNDSISFSRFCGLNIEQVSPDHSTLSRFRTAMSKQGVFDKLFKAINRQLEEASIIVKTGIIVDASIVETPRRPKGKKEHKVEENEESGQEIKASIQPGVDQEAAWLNRGKKLYYGYKKHHVTDNEGLVIGVKTTTVNVHEASNLEEVLDSADIPVQIPLKADKGYQSGKNSDILKKRRLKNHILKKGCNTKPLTPREEAFNKAVGKTRFKVERTFGSIKRWFKGGKARYVGIEKMHTQNVLEAICYNLYRSPGIVASRCLT